jgi:hypothetical protein
VSGVTHIASIIRPDRTGTGNAEVIPSVSLPFDVQLQRSSPFSIRSAMAVGRWRGAAPFELRFENRVCARRGAYRTVTARTHLFLFV